MIEKLIELLKEMDNQTAVFVPFKTEEEYADLADKMIAEMPHFGLSLVEK